MRGTASVSCSAIRWLIQLCSGCRYTYCFGSSSKLNEVVMLHIQFSDTYNITSTLHSSSSAHVHHVYQLSAHPTHPSSLISAVSCNNEVSVWDMETATRRQMLWASPAQPFGEMTDNVIKSSIFSSYCIYSGTNSTPGGGAFIRRAIWMRKYFGVVYYNERFHCIFNLL